MLTTPTKPLKYANARHALSPPPLIGGQRGGEEPEVRRSQPDALEGGLPLGRTDRGDHQSAARGNLTEDRHEQFAPQHDEHDPERQGDRTDRRLEQQR
jgi:hypothetical protein